MVLVNVTVFKPCVHRSKTVVHPAARKILESAGGQENIPAVSSGNAAVSEPDTVADGAKTTALTGKRLCTVSGSNAPAKRSKVTKTAPKPKVVPLQKGQKKLSAFFRM